MHGLLLLRISQDVHSRRSGGVVAGGHSPPSLGEPTTQRQLCLGEVLLKLTSCSLISMLSLPIVMCTELYALL